MMIRNLLQQILIHCTLKTTFINPLNVHHIMDASLTLGKMVKIGCMCVYICVVCMCVRGCVCVRVCASVCACVYVRVHLDVYLH